MVALQATTVEPVSTSIKIGPFDLFSVMFRHLHCTVQPLVKNSQINQKLHIQLFCAFTVCQDAQTL